MDQQLPPPEQQHQKSLRDHPMVVLQPGERVICEIKRHPFGILTMYIAGVAVIAVAILLAFMAPNLVDQYSFEGNLAAMTTIGILVTVVGVGLILAVATTVYWQNRWIVTDDSITQITQVSLFGRQVSQLSMENLEDITVDQHGIIQTMFNFGTLKAETAGEKSKFTFMYCPDPNKYARIILEVHETFLHQIRHQPQPVNPISPMGDNSRHYQQYSQQPGQSTWGHGQPYGQQPQSAQPQNQNQSQPPMPQQGQPYPPAYGQSPQQPYQDQDEPRQPQRHTTLPPNLQ